MPKIKNNCWTSYAGDIPINLDGMVGSDSELLRTLGFVGAFVLGNEHTVWEH